MKRRIEHLACEVRKTVDVESLGSDIVFHYSISVLDASGDGEYEPAHYIGSSKTLLRGGEILISKLNPRKARVVRAEAHDVPTVCSAEFIPLAPRAVHPRFLEYLLLAETTRQTLDARVQSVTRSQQRVRPDELMKLWVDVPCTEEQAAIANYLDRETARIDALVQARQRLISLLEERWQVVMHQAVAGQLVGGHRARRPTAVPWLESVPTHWREGLLKRVAKLGSGHTPSRSHPEWWRDPTIRWITTGEVIHMRTDSIEYITETRECISELGMRNSAATLHPAGTVVLCRTASAGYSAIMGVDMATSQDFATWTCGPDVHPRYVLLCLRVMRQDLLGRLAMGSTHKTIYMPDIESVQVPIPPVDEQDHLMDAAWAEHSGIGQALASVRRQVELLEERRQALITSAVTGQIKAPVTA